MTVFSSLFEKISARVPDAAEGADLLAEGLRADPISLRLAQREADKEGRSGKSRATDALFWLVRDTYEFINVFHTMKVPLKFSIQEETAEVEGADWDFYINSVKITMKQDDKLLLSFKVSPVATGGYFVEAEEHAGGGGISLSMVQNGPAANIAAVEEALATHLDSSLRIPAAQAAPVLRRMIELIDHRPQTYLTLIKEAPFAEVLDFVKNGINPGHVYTEYPGNFLPLDWVLMSRYAEVGPNNSIEPFTAEQRRELFEAIVAQAKDPSTLHSDMTLRQTVLHTAYEFIPRLVELGAKPDASHFIEVGGHEDKTRTLETLKALRPYTHNVNAMRFGTSAGSNAAYRADLESFKWLETQGLDKTQTAGNNFRSYAHAVVASTQRHRSGAAGAEDGYPAMLHYLIDNGYDFTSKGPAGTPVQMAVENGNLDLAKILIEAGALPDASLMIKLLTPVFYGRGFPMQRNVSGAEAVEFMRYLHDEHAVPYTQEVADAPAALLQSAATYNFFKADFAGLKPLAEMMNFLATQGAVPTETDALKTFRLESAEKLRGIDAETAKTFGIEALPALPRASRLRRTPSP